MGTEHILIFPAPHCLIHQAEETWGGRDGRATNHKRAPKAINTLARESMEAGLLRTRGLPAVCVWRTYDSITSPINFPLPGCPSSLPCDLLPYSLWSLNKRPKNLKGSKMMQFPLLRVYKRRKKKLADYFIHPKERKQKLIGDRCCWKSFYRGILQ